VDDIEQVINDMERTGIEMKDKIPQQGANNSKIAFAEKEGFRGVTVEFIQSQF
jgi:hypothetical protein